MVVASREGRNASNKVQIAAYTTMRATAVDNHQAVHCLSRSTRICRMLATFKYVKRRWWSRSALVVSTGSQRSHGRSLVE